MFNEQKAGRWGWSDASRRVVNAIIQRHIYRTGLLREEIPLRNGRRDGVHHTWHKDGVLASEEPYDNGLLHGICRQWDEDHLLGEYEMNQEWRSKTRLPDSEGVM